MMRRTRHCEIVAVAVFACAALFPIPGAAEDAVSFSRDVQPILTRYCVQCHGGVKRESGLSLLNAEGAQAGGKSGKAVLTPGGELIRRIMAEDADERMPAEGGPLSQDEIAVMRRWVEAGAAWPRHWSLEPSGLVQPPVVANQHWPRGAIDYFVLRRLEAADIAPSPEADRATLLRRVYLDLIGLPPPPEAVAAFLTDDSPRAYERMIDQLLASPRFGERWGRHWLDLARYGDTDGYEVDGARPNAWYWRDWVIDAINRDMPFDRFTIEQLAGDLLAGATDEQRLATGFHRQTLTNKEGGIDKEEYRVYAVMDRVNTTATVWLGLTVACAQCHDHPSDPVTQRDYYGLFAFFNNADEAELRPDASTDTAAMERYEKRLAEHRAKVADLKQRIERAERVEKAMLGEELKKLEAKPPSDPRPGIAVMAEREEPRETYLLHRGDFLAPRKDQPITPAVIAALPAPADRSKSGLPDRLQLARWIVDPANPLTARVAVNHIWLHLFGEGLVRTTEDFGATGEPPTHPDLLDWLAREFVTQGWSRKKLIRTIVLSATYRQSSSHRPAIEAIDPANTLLHRQNRRRVEAEIMRDMYLSAAELLSDRVGGPSVFPPLPGAGDLMKIDFRSDLKWEVSEGADRYRRGMYTFFKRTLPDPNLVMFDAPDGCLTAAARRTSNTPLQALALLNNEVFVEATQGLARRVLAPPDYSDMARIDRAAMICLGRPATELESRQLLDLLREARLWYGEHESDARAAGGDAETAAWSAVAAAMLNLDAFVTRE